MSSSSPEQPETTGISNQQKPPEVLYSQTQLGISPLNTQDLEQFDEDFVQLDEDLEQFDEEFQESPTEPQEFIYYRDDNLFQEDGTLILSPEIKSNILKSIRDNTFDFILTPKGYAIPCEKQGDIIDVELYGTNWLYNPITQVTQPSEVVYNSVSYSSSFFSRNKPTNKEQTDKKELIKRPRSLVELTKQQQNNKIKNNQYKPKQIRKFFYKKIFFGIPNKNLIRPPSSLVQLVKPKNKNKSNLPNKYINPVREEEKQKKNVWIEIERQKREFN